MTVWINSIPSGPRGTIAQHIYINGADQPSCTILVGSNGPFPITLAQWRLCQLLARSGSRFI